LKVCPEILRAKNKRAAEKLIAKLDEFIKENEGTRAAKKAAVSIEDLQKVK